MIRTLLAILGLIVAIAIFYLVFLSNRKPAPFATPLNVNLNEIKPEQWKPYGDGLVLVNLDYDQDPEWLFFYRDEYTTGQIGGIIYDAQNRPRGDGSISIPSQVPVYLIPYKLLPDYLPGKSNGYLGDEAIDYKLVDAQRILTPTPTPPPQTTPTPSPKTLRGGRLMVRGHFRQRVNRFSVHWWQGPEVGYGSTLATTPGWFSLNGEDPGDWGKWAQSPKDIRTLWAWEPQIDRSNICQVAQWDLIGDLQRMPPRWYFVAHYEEKKLRFCSSTIPSEPAFPEGQVLAYLLDGRANRWKEGVQPVPFSDVHVLRLTEPEILNVPPERPVVPVDVDFESNGVIHSMRWLVEMIPPTSIKDPVRWRIIQAEDR